MIRKYIYKLRYILIVLSALLGLLGLSSSFGYEFVPCYIGGQYDCLKVYNGESVSVGNIDYSFNNGNIVSTYGGDTINGLFTTYYNSVKVGKNLFFNGNFYLFGKYDVGVAYNTGNVCIMQDNQLNAGNGSNTCLYNGYGWGNFYSSKSVDQFNQFFNNQYDYVIFPYQTLSQNYVKGDASVCFHFPDFGQFLCLGNLSLGYGNAITYDGFVSATDSDFDNVVGVNFPFGLGAGSGGSTDFGGVFGSDFDITNGVIIDDYEKRGFSKEICFGGSFSGNQLITAPGTGLDIFSLFSDGDHNPLGFDNIIDRYSYYRESIIEYRNISSGSAFFYSGAFHYAHWNLFANMLRYGVSIYPVYDIIDYCDLVIDSINDPTTLNDLYDGDLEEWEKQSIVDNYTIINYYGLSGFELSGSFSTLTGYSGSDFDLSAFDFFKDLSVSFNNRLGQVNGNLFGFIPSYILVFMFALIFIRILRK